MKRHCPQCGTKVIDELPGGLCPTCLMAVAKQSQASLDGTFTAPQEVYGVDTPTLQDIAAAFPELEVIQFIGRGGMGAVYKVRQKNLDRIVALKVFLYRSDDPEFAARFQREARALGRLNHPNIVTVHDFGQRDDFHFLVMEFVDGLNLRQISAEERLSSQMALQMVPQLCEALQYAHDNGVIHRDIKPENLLLDTDGKIKIADFGLAKMTGGRSNGTLTRTQQVMGTLNYMAPEQRERPTEVDHRADIYSLGVVIYELLTGELPLGRFQPPSSKSNVDKQLDEVVMRALEKEPELRYQQASEFATGFRSVGGHAPARAPVPPRKATAGIHKGARGTRCMITMMSGREKRGRWTPGDPQLAFTVMGGTCLDLSDVEETNVDLTLFTLMGGTEIIVPHGADVDMDGLIIMGATENNVKMTQQPSTMNVRIRSWGAMGGCEVRTPKPSEIRAAEGIKMHQYRKLSESELTFGSAMMLIYTTFCMLVTLAIPVFFIASAFHVIDEEFGRFLGVIAAISCWLCWTLSDYVRILVGAGPEEDDPESLRKYYSASKLGTLVRMFGTSLMFVCGMLFVAFAFDLDMPFSERFGKMIAIIVGIAGVMICSWAILWKKLFTAKNRLRLTAHKKADQAVESRHTTNRQPTTPSANPIKISRSCISSNCWNFFGTSMPRPTPKTASRSRPGAAACLGNRNYEQQSESYFFCLNATHPGNARRNINAWGSGQ